MLQQQSVHRSLLALVALICMFFGQIRSSRNAISPDEAWQGPGQALR